MVYLIAMESVWKSQDAWGCGASVRVHIDALRVCGVYIWS